MTKWTKIRIHVICLFSSYLLIFSCRNGIILIASSRKTRLGHKSLIIFFEKMVSNGFNQVLKPKSTKGRDPHFLCQQSPFINKGQHKSPKSSLARLHDLRRPGYRKLVGIYFYGSMKLVPRRFLKRSKLEILDKLGMLVKKSSKC